MLKIPVLSKFKLINPFGNPRHFHLSILLRQGYGGQVPQPHLWGFCFKTSPVIYHGAGGGVIMFHHIACRILFCGGLFKNYAIDIRARRERSVTVPPADRQVFHDKTIAPINPPQADRNGLKPFLTGQGLSEINTPNRPALCTE